ncbi:MAG: xanthine dehydrogenase family protein subunit M [Deltaproteobacteria bacterium]|nr:xanthine dehydrogenase family protein subunit M [Deltaproteobacteria bacterium]
MLLPHFEFHEPTTVSEACEIMGRLREKARPIAGGTDLIVNMKKNLIRPDHVVSLAKIDDLKGIVRENGLLEIGACVTAAEIAGSDAVEKKFAALAQGARVLGSPLIRNLATISGNVVSARPAADLPPPLMAYGARAVLMKTSGERSVDLNDFFKAPGKTVMDPDEILTRIVIEAPQGHYGDSYVKLGLRQTFEISLVNVAAFISLDGSDGPISKARVILGSVGPTPIRSQSAEDVLGGQMPSEPLFARAGEAAAGDAQPIDDFRGSAEYRRDMVAVLTRRALNMALKRAGSR